MIRQHTLPEPVVKRAAAFDKGRQWLKNLDQMIDELEAEWHIRVGETLSGGTHSFAAAAGREDGTPCILKIHLPEETDSDDFAHEIRFLQMAKGMGYVTMYAADMGKKACLLERLGEPLSQAGYSVQEQIRIICETLEQIWQIPAADAKLPDGRASIGWFRSFIQSAYESSGRPCPAEVIKQAMQFLDDREAHLQPDRFVPVHGDANPQNILRVPGTEDCYKLIDADGLFYEKASDLGVLMREWREEYQTDPLQKGMERCAYLHQITGVDRQAIWEWGYLQCVATALTALQILPEDARFLLQIAQEWQKKPVLP